MSGRCRRLRFACLGSGSRGNAVVIEADGSRVLVDCGFPLAQLKARLARLGCPAHTLRAILLSHEHRDHAAGVGAAARAFGLPVWTSRGTLAAAELGTLPEVRLFRPGTPFAVDGLEVTPFAVAHDAREPCQFVFSDGRHRLALLTDAGRRTPEIERRLDRCDALLIECNHDPELLRTGPYPEWLQARIGGPYGHLDNMTAAQLLAALDGACLQHVVAMHLSQVNNRPALAREALAARLDCKSSWIQVADQEQGLPWRELW